MGIKDVIKNLPVMETKGDYFGVASDQLINNFLTFVFRGLPRLLFGLAIFYTLYNILSPMVVIVR